MYLKGVFAGTKFCTDGTKVSLTQVLGVDVLQKIVSPSTLIPTLDTTPYWRTFFTDFLGNISLNCSWKDLWGLISDISWRVSEGRFCLDKTWNKWDNCNPRSSAWSRCASKDCFSDHSHTHNRHNATLRSPFHWLLGKHKPQLQLKDLLCVFNCIKHGKGYSKLGCIFVFPKHVHWKCTFVWTYNGTNVTHDAGVLSVSGLNMTDQVVSPRCLVATSQTSPAMTALRINLLYHQRRQGLWKILPMQCLHNKRPTTIWSYASLNCGIESCSWCYKTWSKVHRRTQHLEGVLIGYDEQRGVCGMKSIHTPSKTIFQTQSLVKSWHSHQQLKAFTFYSQSSVFIIDVVAKYELSEHFCLDKTLSSNRNRIPWT